MIRAGYSRWLQILTVCFSCYACSSEFDAQIMSEPTPVIYGIINPADSLYQIRLTKSFIGPGSAYLYAANPDSIYYDNARVFLESHNFSGKLIDRTELFPREIEVRESGIFVREPNTIYETDFKSIRLRPEILEGDGIPFNIDLYIKIEIPGNAEPTEAVTRLKSDPRIIAPRGNFQKVYFYGESPFFMEWAHSDPDTYFEIKVVMRYREILVDGERDTEVFWVLKGIQINKQGFPGGTRSIYSYYFRPENFYSQVRAAIPPDPLVKGRSISDIDFIILTSDGVVKEYNEIENITNDYNGASYTNITNGLGLFSSYNTKGVYKQKLGPREMDSLALGSFTKHLNFNRWE